MPINLCAKCGRGLDLVAGATPACPECGTVWDPSQGAGRKPTMGDLFLIVGEVICFLGCVFSIVKVSYNLLTLQLAYSIINVTITNSVLLICYILLDGFLSFCFYAALFVVFVRMRHRE